MKIQIKFIIKDAYKHIEEKKSIKIRIRCDDFEENIRKNFFFSRSKKKFE